MHRIKIKITIGLLIESLRNYRGYSIHELSEQSGVSERTIRRIENEECLARRSTCEKLSFALDSKWDDLEDQYEFDRSPRSSSFKGGKQSKRDKEWPELKDHEFRKWWHREGKNDYGGEDIQSRKEAKCIYEKWKNGSKNRIKLITKFNF